MKTYFHTGCLGISFLWIGMFFGGFAAKAQNGYTLVGSARNSSQSDCYQITVDRTGQNGAVWYEKPLRLNESFELEFTINFGSNTGGADGVVMVMQTIGNRVLGNTGSGIGFQGLKPSLGIEFDTHRNVNLGDPVADHIALVRDGISDHRLNSAFAAPVPITTTSNNVKNGRDYYIKVKWNAINRLLQIDVNCVQRINQVVDLVKDVFTGFQEVYWGFTSSTGSSSNIHTVCLKKDIIVRDTFQVCRMDTLTLIANNSIDNKYDWQPAIGLNNSHIRTPLLTATTDQLYTVSYLDYCSVPKTDSVFVDVKTSNLDIGGNKEACENQAIELNPVLTPANDLAKFRWSTGDTTRQLNPKTSGLYILEVTTDGCISNDSSVVTFHPYPKRGFQNDPIYDCPTGQPLILNPLATGTELKYIWTPGNSSDSTFEVSTPGSYTVEIRNGFGCTIDQLFTVLDNCSTSVLVFVPNTFTPNGDGKNEVFIWKSNTDVEARMSIFNRWGEIVFSSEDPKDFWNGTSKGQLCPSNTYTWRLEYRSPQSKASQWAVKSGEVLLLR